MWSAVFHTPIKEELVGDAKTGGGLGFHDLELMEFRILRGRNKAKNRTISLDFRRADFGLFRNLL